MILFENILILVSWSLCIRFGWVLRGWKMESDRLLRPKDLIKDGKVLYIPEESKDE